MKPFRLVSFLEKSNINYLSSLIYFQWLVIIRTTDLCICKKPYTYQEIRRTSSNILRLIFRVLTNRVVTFSLIHQLYILAKFTYHVKSGKYEFQRWFVQRVQFFINSTSVVELMRKTVYRTRYLQSDQANRPSEKMTFRART